MVRAAATGAIDFSRADPQDSWWWQRFYWILQELSREGDRQLAEAAQRHFCAQVSCGILDDEDFQRAQQQASTAWRQIHNAVMPWAQIPLEETDADLGRQADKEWRAVYGDPNSSANRAMRAQNMEYFAALQQRHEARERGEIE